MATLKNILINGMLPSLQFLISGLLIGIVITGCNKKPTDVTAHFLDDLSSGQFNSAKRVALLPVQQQIEIIRQDTDALFNGQQWKYAIVKEVVKDDSAKVFFISKLNDGSQLRQTAALCKQRDGWKIANVINTRISYSSHALKARAYADYGNQMLIAPLDLEDITPKNISTHIGKYVMVSGYICDFRDAGKMVVMNMGEDDQKPLLTVMLEGKAADTAKAQHKSHMEIDAMLEEPLGNIFTATGLLQLLNGKPFMEVSKAENVYIGRVLRIEKAEPQKFRPIENEDPAIN